MLEEARQKVFDLLENESWIKWVHEGTTPAHTAEEKTINSSGLGKHCGKCLNLNGCCFPKKNSPIQPLHPFCHCKTEKVYQIKHQAECELSKFTEYIFHPTRNKGKKVMFESWGYDIIDSEWLQAEFIRQGREKYASGDFVLGTLDSYGQRINIVISLPRKNTGEVVSFVSGWMAYPDGVILLATPFGGEL